MRPCTKAGNDDGATSPTACASGGERGKRREKRIINGSLKGENRGRRGGRQEKAGGDLLDSVVAGVLVVDSGMKGGEGR